MEPSCDEETAYPFVVYIIRVNQSECSPLLSLSKDQPISVRHFWVTIPLLWPYNLLVTNLWPICGFIVTHL